MSHRKNFRMSTGPSVPRGDDEIDRMLDIMEERPDPIDELPDTEPIDRLVRSMGSDAVSRYQSGRLL